jgi:hypothetical protein
MTYHSVAEIFAAIDETRERVFRRVENLSSEQEIYRPSADVWSVAEIIEHLAIIEERLTKMLGVMLHKAASAAPGASDGEAKMQPFSLDKYIERSAREKYTAPEAVRPRGGVPLRELLSRMQSSRLELRSLQPRLEALNVSGVTYPHPAFGPLNPYQWVAFIGLHEERHLRQIEAVMSLPEFNKST